MSTITINPPTIFISDPIQSNEATTSYDSAASGDAILDILQSDVIDEADLQALCTAFRPIEADDILTAHFILSTLLKYTHELDNRSLFSILISYDFDRPARQFELDLAVVVMKRAQSLLTEISSWNIHVLKQKVYLLPSLHTDAGTVLTMIVLRIVKSYAILESKLLMVISRSTLVKIHFELSELLSKSDDADTDNNGTNALVLAYRDFVKQLIAEMESSPLESAQESYQIAQDLQSMFTKFSTSHQQHQSSSQQSDMEDSILLDSPQRLSTNPQQFGWQDSNYIFNNKKHNKDHSRSFSLASSFDDLSSTVSTKSSIAAEMPNIMQVFEIAKQEESNLMAMQAGMNAKSPPSPARKGRSRSSLGSTTRRTRTQRRSSPSSLRSWTAGSNSGKRASSGPLALPPISSNDHQPYPSSPLSGSLRSQPMPRSLSRSAVSPSVPSKPDETLNVKKVGDRVMVQVGKDLIDMQDWLNKANSPKPQLIKSTLPPASAPAPAPALAPALAPPPQVRTMNTTSPTSTSSSWLNNLLGNAEKEFASSMGM